MKRSCLWLYLFRLWTFFLGVGGWDFEMIFGFGMSFELVWAGLNKKGGGGIGPIRLEIAGFANSWNFDLDGFDQWETRDF